VERLRPRFQPGPTDDSQYLRSQVLGHVPVAGDDVDRSRFGPIKGFLQVGPQLGEQRDDPLRSAGQVFDLGAAYPDTAALPIDIAPGKGQRFRWAAKPAVVA
jgi:hypothetical protein